MKPTHVSSDNNLIANGLAQGWRAVMSLAFIPLYVNYLGTDAMGLVGLFALLQAWLVVVDLVIRSALWDNSVKLTPSPCGGRLGGGQLEGSEATDFTRPHPNPPPFGEGTVALNSTALGLETAPLSDGANVAQSIRTRLHKLELIGFAVAATVALGLWTASSGLASVWCAADGLMTGNIPVAVVAQAFAMMGVVIALQIIESIYAGGLAVLSGENRPARTTTLISLMATVRGLGAVGVLVWASPNLNPFFIWQGVVSLISVILFAGAIYHTLPPVPQPARDRSLKNNVVANYFATWKPNLSRYRRLAKEGSWIVIGQIASMLGSLVLVRVLTEHLDPTQYGQLALGLTVAGLVNQVVMGGVNNGIGRFYSIAAEQQDLGGYLYASWRLMLYATSAVLVIGLILMGGLVFLGYTQWMALAAAALMFSVLSGYNSSLNGIQNAARQRAIVAFHGGLDAWLKILLALGVMFWLGNSSTAVVMGYALSSFLITGSQFIFLRRLIPRQRKPTGDSRQWMIQMWTYAWPFSTWGAFTWVQQSSDRWALEIFTTTQDVGQYAVLMQLGYTPIALATGLAMSFLGPILFQRSGDVTNHARNANVHRLVWLITLFCMAFTLIAFILALCLHGWIFWWLVAIDYRGVSYLLPWMVLAGGVFAAGQMLTLKMMSELKSTAMIGAKIGTAILGVLFNLYGASVAGVTGVAKATVAFSTIYFLWMFLLSLRLNTAAKIA